MLRMIFKRFTILFATFSICALLFFGCSSMQKIPSKWDKAEIKIDGNDSEWQKNMYFVENDKIMVGTKNDENYFYFCLKTSDRATIRSIMTLGLTVWVNNSDNKDKKFGIHYPLNFMGKGERMRVPEFDNPEKNKPDDMKHDIDEKLSKLKSQMEILINDDEDSWHTDIDEAKTKYKIMAEFNNVNDIFVYELAIPLKSDYSELSINPVKDMPLGIGLETGEFKRPERNMNSDRGSGMPGEMPPMGGGGMFPGGGGRGGGMRGGSHGRLPESGDRSSMEQLKVWLEVQLATQ
jgi:hypothetical protein